MDPPHPEVPGAGGSEVEATEEGKIDEVADDGPAGNGGIDLGIAKAEGFKEEAGESEGKEEGENEPVSGLVSEAGGADAPAAVEGEEATEAESNAEDIHGQFIEQVVGALMEIDWALIGDGEEGGADGEDDEAAEKEDVEDGTERLAMDAFLGGGIDG